jgi:hypothetical protein
MAFNVQWLEFLPRSLHDTNPTSRSCSRFRRTRRQGRPGSMASRGAQTERDCASVAAVPSEPEAGRSVGKKNSPKDVYKHSSFLGERGARAFFSLIDIDLYNTASATAPNSHEKKRHADAGQVISQPRPASQPGTLRSRYGRFLQGYDGCPCAHTHRGSPFNSTRRCRKKF